MLSRGLSARIDEWSELLGLFGARETTKAADVLADFNVRDDLAAHQSVGRGERMGTPGEAE